MFQINIRKVILALASFKFLKQKKPIPRVSTLNNKQNWKIGSA